jgi:hypothetical protein
MDDTTLHATIEDQMMKMKNLDFSILANILRKEVPLLWKKKSFTNDFDYLKVSIPWWLYLIHFFIGIGVCVLAFVCIPKIIDN